jgi:hypothetical protein
VNAKHQAHLRIGANRPRKRVEPGDVFCHASIIKQSGSGSGTRHGPRRSFRT